MTLFFFFFVFLFIIFRFSQVGTGEQVPEAALHRVDEMSVSNVLDGKFFDNTSFAGMEFLSKNSFHV